MSVRNIRLGVIGAGNMASRHLEAAISLPGVTVTGITSRSRDKAAAMASKFGAPVVADDLGELLRQASPDALLVLVSANQVARVATEAIGAGLPLFLEKPAGLSPTETESLADAATARGVPTMVGYNRRYYSVFHHGLDLVNAHGGLLGASIEGHERIEKVRAAARHPDDVLAAWLYANATHTVDLLRFFGGEVRSLRGYAYRRHEPLVDGIAAAMEFESGALGQYGAHWRAPAGWRVALYADGLAVEFAPLETGRWTRADGSSGVLEPESVDTRFKPGLHGQMAAFCGLARTGRATWPALDLAGAARTMRLAEALADGASS